MNNLKSYNELNEEVRDFDNGLNLDLDSVINRIPKDPEDPVYKRIKEIAKEGNLYKYLATAPREFTFGMLKALHSDAIKFRKD